MIKKILRLFLGVIVFGCFLRAQTSSFSTAGTTDFSRFDFKDYLNQPCVALTFDDGPHQEFTSEILAILKQEGAKATFFVVGKQVKMYPGLLKEIAASGNEIGNHTYNHFNLTTLTPQEVVSEIKSNEEIIKQVTGINPRFFRPPGGHYNANIVDIAKENGEDMALWSIASRDTDRPTSEYICRRVLLNVQNKSVILMHSGVKQTLEALPVLITELKKKGFSLVTLSELDERKEKI
jgi:peptidoglycan/xylan/chitin deacetylase (PgdA/CDA1 family)